MPENDRRYVPFSYYYSQLAYEAITNAAPVPTDPEGRYPLPTISNVVIVVAFQTEAMINEIAYWLHVHPTYRRPMPPEVFDRRTNTLEKWQIVPKTCGAPGFDAGARPFQDLDTLIDLRNSLAHSSAYPASPKGVLGVLKARGCLLSLAA